MILVTGGAGYIGSILVPTLLREGHNVMVLDNFLYGQSSLLDCCADERLTVVRGDARDKDTLRTCMEKVEVIIPLACLTGARILPLNHTRLNRCNDPHLERIYSLGLGNSTGRQGRLQRRVAATAGYP